MTSAHARPAKSNTVQLTGRGGTRRREPRSQLNRNKRDSRRLSTGGTYFAGYALLYAPITSLVISRAGLK
jgi:hypothetical protein